MGSQIAFSYLECEPDLSCCMLYIAEPWFDMYLRDRRAVVLNHNPFMSFTDDPRPEYNAQVKVQSHLTKAIPRAMNGTHIESFMASIATVNALNQVFCQGHNGMLT